LSKLHERIHEHIKVPERKGGNKPLSEKKAKNITAISKLKTYSTVQAKAVVSKTAPTNLSNLHNQLHVYSWHAVSTTRSFQWVKTYRFEFSSTNGLFL